MSRLSATDSARLVEALGELYAAVEHEDYPQQILETVQRLVPCDIASYNVVDPKSGLYHFFVRPSGAIPEDLEPFFVRHLPEHPLLVYHQEHETGEAIRLSDVVTRRQFHQSALYTEFFRHIHVEYQLVFAIVRAGGQVLGVALNRQREDFKASEREMLERLRGHWYNAERLATTSSLLLQAASLGGREILLVSRSGDVQWATDRALEWLAGYFSAAESLQSRLPDEVIQWMKQQHALITGKAGVVAWGQQALVLRSGEDRLTIRLIPSDPATDQTLILLESEAGSVDVPSLVRQGLTEREAEVMTRLKQGKTNNTIADELILSPRTVQTHLANIYAKLGVSSRTAAVARVLELSGAGSPAGEIASGHGWKTYRIGLDASGSPEGD